MHSRPANALLLLDACCLINLAATEAIDEILSGLPYSCATSDFVVENEVLSILSADGVAKESIPPSYLRSLSSLSVVSLLDDEFVSFLRFALELDDGEASVCALAESRGGIVATDDRKALRVIASTKPGIPAIQTPNLLYEWHEVSRIDRARMRGMIAAIEERARFRPRRDHPLFDWWNDFLL